MAVKGHLQATKAVELGDPLLEGVPEPSTAEELADTSGICLESEARGSENR